MTTDTDRIDFIEMLLKKDDVGQGCGVSIKDNQLISSQPGMDRVPIQIFTIPGQHQYGTTARDVIDRAMEVL